MEVLGIFQALIGAFLFLAAGYSVSMAIFKKGEVDEVERLAYGLAFSLIVPALVLFFLNFVFGIPVFTTLYVYAVYVLVIAAALAYGKHTGNLNLNHLKFPGF